MYTQQPPKNPTLSAILSFIIAGLGQIYNGEVVKGIVIIVVQIVNVLLMGIFIGFITWPVVWIWSIYDAHKVAKRINEEAMQQAVETTKVCPQCAERVNSGAKVCHFCGYQFMPDTQQLAAPPVAAPVVIPAMPEPMSASRADGSQAVSQVVAPAAVVQAPVATATARYCPNCGQPADASARFCMSCGNPLGQAAPNTSSDDAKESESPVPMDTDPPIAQEPAPMADTAPDEGQPISPTDGLPGEAAAPAALQDLADADDSVATDEVDSAVPMVSLDGDEMAGIADQPEIAG